MDDPRPGDDQTLLDLFDADRASIAPDTWIAFYHAKGFTPSHMGLLSFRVAQLYQVITTRSPPETRMLRSWPVE
jgi:hypothetical protein